MIVLAIPDEVWEVLPEPADKASPSNPLGRSHSDSRDCVYFYDGSGRVIQLTNKGWIINRRDYHVDAYVTQTDATLVGPFPDLKAAAVAWKLGL